VAEREGCAQASPCTAVAILALLDGRPVEWALIQPALNHKKGHQSGGLLLWPRG